MEAFCHSGQVEAESLTRGRRAAFLVQFHAQVGADGLQWHQVLDGPKSQVEAFELAQWLRAGGGTHADIAQDDRVAQRPVETPKDTPLR